MRDRFNDFVARHEVAWELIMAGLAILYVAIGLLIDQAILSKPALEAVELGLTGLFVAEFGGRFYAARDRRQYLRGHWIDLLALAPPIRSFRVLRLLRLLRMVRAFAGMYRAAMHIQGIARHRGFAWLLVAWLAVMVVCSVALYVAEHGVNKAIDSPFDALWWGVVTLTSVGYGDVYPITPEGRLIAMVLMLLGIGLFSALTATITSYLVATDGPGRQRGLGSELERLVSLSAEGSLTDDEFSAAKSRVIRGLG